MKRATIIFIAMIAGCNCFALHLGEPNQALVTAEPNACPSYGKWWFDVSGGAAVWIDNRDDINYVSRIYFVYLNDPCRTEYLIDADAIGSRFIKICGSDVFYTRIAQDADNIIIRKADCAAPNNPVIKDINTPACGSGDFPDEIVSLDVSGSLLVYAIRDENGNSQIYAIDLDDPCFANRLVYDCNNDSGHLQANVALDGTSCVWSGNVYDPCAEQYYNFLAVADVADVNNPLIQKTAMPRSSGNELWLDSLDISGDWLAAYGRYNSGNEIFGIHNFQNADANQWAIVELWDGAELNSEPYAPAIDGSYAVWPAMMYGGGETASAIIAGATLLDNGSATVRTLKENYDTNADLKAVHISGGEIVWSLYYNDFFGLEYTELYSGALVSDCGDWGYSSMDFNYDCSVNFLDFATFAEDVGVNFLELSQFAERWLECTTPGGGNCVYGEIYSNSM